MSDRTKEKTEVLEQHKSSHAILRLLEMGIEWRWQTDRFSHEVRKSPIGIHFETELLNQVLEDLAQYTEYAESDIEIPECLQYIEPFWTSNGVESEERRYG